MQPIAGASDTLVMLFCLLFAPEGQKEFAIDLTSSSGQVKTSIVVKTAGGYDFYVVRNGVKGDKSGEVVIDPKTPSVMTYKKDGQVQETADFAEVLKAIKPFDKAPLQAFTIKDAKFKVKADGSARQVLVDGQVLTIRPLATPTTSSAPASRPAATTKPASGPADDHGRIAKDLIDALGSADLDALKKAYADEVILMAGSELLKDDWGLLANGPRDKDPILGRDKLIEGYGKLIGKVGKEKWQAMFAKLTAEKITTSFVAEDGPPGLKKGDMAVVVRPGPRDDKLTFYLRKAANGKWLVVAEQTDY